MKLDNHLGLHRYKKTFLIFIGLFIPVCFGFLSISFGKDTNWDLKNYHYYYNAYAFLEDRLDYDIAPAAKTNLQ